jgi:hypothetical protein
MDRKFYDPNDFSDRRWFSEAIDYGTHEWATLYTGLAIAASLIRMADAAERANKILVSGALSLKRMADAAERANKILERQLDAEALSRQDGEQGGTGSRADGEGGTPTPIEKDRG